MCDLGRREYCSAVFKYFSAAQSRMIFLVQQQSLVLQTFAAYLHSSSLVETHLYPVARVLSVQ